MAEKSIFRICLDCGQDKRTTVHEDEEEKYYCEECQKRTARIAYSDKGVRYGAWILIGVAVVAFIAGYLVRGLF